MVRYVFNSWRRRQDLLLVRRQFYPHEHRDDSRDDDVDGDDHDDRDRDVKDARHLAVGRVSMWMTRQHCPHLVESTALLTAALLTDDADDSRRVSSSSSASVAYAVRATYAAAFSRFVTGLLDGHQDKLRKQSMYTIAASIGLPSAFVELRHQSTHEQLPSRARLRLMAERALVWIWNYYWKHLDAEHHRDDECRAAVLAFLRAADEGGDDVEREAKQRAAAIVRRWDKDRVLATISRLQSTLPGNQAFLKCLSLSRHVMEQPRQEVEPPPPPPPTRSDQGGVVVEADATVLDADTGGGVDDDDDDDDAPAAWSLLVGPWKPTPIGVALQLALMIPPRLPRRHSLVQSINKLAARRAMHIQSIPMWVGSSNNYAYLVVDDKSKDAVIIDPANPPEVTPVLKKAIDDGSIKLKAIVNTHHHWDHAGGNKKLLAELDTVPNLDVVGGKDCEAVTKTPAHGETWKLGDISVKSVHTPCHTQDSICYLMEDQTGRAVFTGDTLFVGVSTYASYLAAVTMSRLPP
ncbi:hypothetical protein CP532_4493 [Ophiocordyceps camponoti-leonardi (nom. inval.)]|nr:hypothetical protein CP532_4493 [Ophiocordyceps camponoti-leonardi (nom. inval.)]